MSFSVGLILVKLVLMITVEEIVKHIQGHLTDSEVYAKDLTGTQDHYEVFVICDDFEAKSKIAAHRLVMDALKEPLKGPLHALSLKTFTKSQWQEQMNS